VRTAEARAIARWKRRLRVLGVQTAARRAPLRVRRPRVVSGPDAGVQLSDLPAEVEQLRDGRVVDGLDARAR